MASSQSVFVTAVADRGIGIFSGVVGEAALSNQLTPTADEVASQLDALALNLKPRVYGNR